ncbi:MAG: DUF1573 domain-containing protein [Mucilaginibacter sp.]
MKKLILGIVSICLLMACHNSSGTNSSVTAAPALGGPVMKFEKEAYDFGKIKSGAQVTYNFKFTNTGRLPLIITDAVASCGCTRPEWPKAPVNPHESGVIKVTFNSAGKSGLQDKQITITANTNPAQNLVHLIGEVDK